MRANCTSMTTHLRHLIAVSVVASSVLVAPVAQSAETTYTWEECEEGWKVESGSATQTPQSGWRREAPGNASTMAYHAGPTYVGDASESLISPGHKWKGGTVNVSFAIRYQFEPTETSLGADNVSIDWSKDGKNWIMVETYQPLSEGFPAFTTKEVSFKAPKGNVYIRFHLASDALVEGYGASVDDVTINAAKPSSANC